MTVLLMLEALVVIYVGDIICQTIPKSSINLLADTTFALSHRYFVGCTVVLHSQSPEHPAPKLLALFKTLAMDLSNQGRLSIRNIRTYPNYLKGDNYEPRCARIMHVVFGNETQFREPFTMLTHIVPMAGPLWFIILERETPIATFLERINAPFDVDMLVGQLAKNGSVILHEVYRASMHHPVRVDLFGRYSEKEGLISPDHVTLYHRRSDFEGIVFKVGLADTYPLLNIVRLDNGRVNITGYFAEIWKELEVRLNFSSAYFVAADNRTGMRVNGSWSGVMGMLVGRKVDVGITSLTISPERSEVVDFLRPLLSSRNQLFFRKPGIEIRWNTILRPFGQGIWLTLLAWLLVGSAFAWLFFRVGVRSGTEKTCQEHEYSYMNALFIITRAFSQQGSSFLPQASSSRILLMTSYLAGVVMLSAYSGVLISFIAVETPKEPFSSLLELLQDGSYRVKVVKDSAAYMYFANSGDKVLSEVYTRLIEPSESSQLAPTIQSGLESVCDDNKVVFFGPQASAEHTVTYLNKRGCDILMLRRALDLIYQSIAIRKRNQYKDALNYHLDMMNYHGLLGRMHDKIWLRLDPLTRSKVIEVGTEQVIEIYMVLLAGIIVAVFLFLVEMVWRNRQIKSAMDKKFMKVSQTSLNWYRLPV